MQCTAPRRPLPQLPTFLGLSKYWEQLARETARQLEELIEERLGHRNFDLGVLPIKGQKGGFRARVFGGLTLNASEQEQVDEVVRTLRTEYYLIEG